VKNTSIPTSWNRNLIYKTIAIASLATGSSFASAAPACGPIVSVDQGQCVINSGSDLTINNGVTVEAGSSTFYAVTITSDLQAGSTVTNNGTISAAAGENPTIYAAGIYANGDVDGAVINEGLIQVSGTATTGTGLIRAIDVSGSVYGGEITNNGTIDVDLIMETTYTAYAHGIYIRSGIYNSGSVTNNGLIDIDVSNTSDAIYANGIFNEPEITSGGSIVNGGTIDVNINASSSAAAGYGIYQNGHVFDGEITNNGAINVTVVGKNAEGFGISVDGSVYSSGSLIENEGSITVGVTGSADATAFGIDIGGRLYNGSQLVNSGVIDLTANGGDAEAIGIFAGEVYSGSAIVNSGSIKVLAQAAGDNDPLARGISVRGSVNGGSVVNEGTIKADATALASSAYATGIYANGVYSGGSISNTGTIDVDVKAPDDSAFARGIHIYSYTNNSTVTNEGLIDLNASGSSAYAAGITLNNAGSGTATVIGNSGTINATAVGTDDAFAGGIVGTYDEFTGGIVSGAQAINSGTITAVASVTDATISLGKGGGGAIAAGMISEPPIYSGSFINSESGVINATASSNAGGVAKAYGMAVLSGVYGAGVLENKGVINVTATVEGASGSADARGIYVDAVYGDGSITNSGSIEVSALGANANATGILINTFDQSEAAVIINSGTIRARATGASAFAYSLNISNGKGGTSDTGLVVNAVGGLLDGDLLVGRLVSVSNSGTIIAGGSIGGDYDVSATGTHLVDGVSASDYSQLVVGGTATFADGAIVGVNVDTDLVEYVAGGTTYDNVISAGILSVAGSLGGDTGSIIWEAGAVDDGLNGIDVTVGLVEEANIAIGDVINEGSQFALRVPDTGGAAPLTINNAGTIDGAVSLGDSVLNLQGNSSLVNGDVTGVAGSTVNVAGEFTSGGAFNVGVFNINSGGSFTPLHTLTAAVENDGTFNIGAGQKATIAGSYTQGADGVLLIGVQSVDSYGQLDVTGAVDLSANNTLALKVSVDQTLAVDQTLNDVISAGALTAGVMTIEDDSTFWDFEATVDGNTLDIVTVTGETVVDIVSGEPEAEAEAEAYTPIVYALGIATALDELIALGSNNTDINNLIIALDDLETPEQIANAVAQLVPVLVGQGSLAAQQIVGQIGSVVSQRMSSGRVKGGVSSGDPMMTDAHVWAKVLGTKAEQGEIDGTPGYDADSYSFTLGFDGDINDDTLVGLAFTYSEADIEGDTIANNQMDIEGYQLTGYASYTLDESAFVDVLVTVGSNSNEISRQVNIGVINLAGKADYDSWFTRVYSAIGRDYQVNEQLTITPMLSLSYTYIDEDSYTEKGLGDVGLDVEGRDEESAVAGLDILGVYDVDDQNRITAHVGMGYEMLSDSTIISSSFIGGGSVFKTEGPDRDPENYRFGVGYELNASDSLELRVNYDYEAAEKYDNQILSATARWLW
jgi:uncharacterized protein with beta-barrel porin domain